MQVSGTETRAEVEKKDLSAGKNCGMAVVTVFDSGEKRFWDPELRCP